MSSFKTLIFYVLIVLINGLCNSGALGEDKGQYFIKVKESNRKIDVSYGMWINTTSGKGGLMLKFRAVNRLFHPITIEIKGGTFSWQLWDSTSCKNKNTSMSGSFGSYGFYGYEKLLHTDSSKSDDTAFVELMSFDTLVEILQKSIVINGRVQLMVTSREKNQNVKLTIGKNDTSECIDFNDIFLRK